MTENKNNRKGVIGKIIIFLMMTMLFSGSIVMPVSAENDSESVTTSAVPNPGTDLWREVRQRGGPIIGTTQVQGVDAGVLINTDGEIWRQFRVEQIIPYSVNLSNFFPERPDSIFTSPRINLNAISAINVRASKYPL